MVDLTNAVQWWQEEQVRILVLASVVTQLFLIASTSLRKRAIRPCLRLLIWLAYLGSDALAVYAVRVIDLGREQQSRSSRRTSSGEGVCLRRKKHEDSSCLSESSYKIVHVSLPLALTL